MCSRGVPNARDFHPGLHILWTGGKLQVFLLETNASKEGLGAVLSQKQDDGHYHPIALGSYSLTPAEKNYHSSKLEFLALKWSVTKHFKEYLTYTPFVVRTDNNPLMYVLMTPNLDATRHR